MDQLSERTGIPGSHQLVELMAAFELQYEDFAKEHPKPKSDGT